MRWAEHVARTEERCLLDFVGNPEGKRPLGRLWHMSESYINMDLQAVGWGSVDWMDLNKDRSGWKGIVKVVMNLLVPNSAGNFVIN
jgi:hypothetical protein